MADPLFAATDGPVDGPTLVLLHTIGTDHRLWDPVLPCLPAGLRIIRPDFPGHGHSAVGTAPGRIGALIAAVEDTLAHHSATDTVLLGHGLGGLVAQGLATKRLDLVQALVLSGTATKIETRTRWQTLATAIRRDGADAFARHIGDRWNAPGRTGVPALGTATAEGLAQAAEAMAGADFYTTTAALRLPTIALVGDRDRFTPADLVRETAALIPGAETSLIGRAGHLALQDAPRPYAGHIAAVLARLGPDQN